MFKTIPTVSQRPDNVIQLASEERLYITVTGSVLQKKGPRVIEPRQSEIDTFLLEHFHPEPKIEMSSEQLRASRKERRQAQILT
jgi:hypothetical protein